MLFCCCCCSLAKSCPTLCDPTDRSTLDSSVLHCLPEFAQDVRDAIQPCHPLPAPFSSCLQPFPTSGSFPMSRALRIRWPEYWGFSFSISPSSEYAGLISLRIDWFSLLAAIVHQIFCSVTHNPCSVPPRCYIFVYDPQVQWLNA